MSPSPLVACCLFLSLAGFAQPATRPSRPDPLAWVTTRPNSPVEPGAHLERLADGFMFTEGCTSDAKGNVFFVDQPRDNILEWSAEGKLSVWMHPTGYSNGMCFDADGNLIACADERNELWSIAPDKKATVILRDFEGHAMNGPNDVWIRPDGGMYLTDPMYKRPYWPSSRPAGVQTLAADGREVRGVYFLSADRKTVKRVIDDYKQPNGIIGTPDGKTLYVSDINDGKTWAYAIRPDGSLAERRLFNRFGSDGMTIDSDGNVYTTSRGAVQICSPSGELLDVIPVPGANCCFGGAEGHTLFVTARDTFYGLRMKTHRVGAQ